MKLVLKPCKTCGTEIRSAFDECSDCLLRPTLERYGLIKPRRDPAVDEEPPAPSNPAPVGG